jgi:hypothetical protein
MNEEQLEAMDWADASHANVQYELHEAWLLIHRLVETFRGHQEHDHPRVFRDYEALCEQFGEGIYEVEVK